MRNLHLVRIVINEAILAVFMLPHTVEVFSQGVEDAVQNSREHPNSITANQVTLIKTILSKFSAAKLTVADAKAIHEKLREAGIHGGPETNDAIKAAGFDPEKLRELDPPPPVNLKNGTSPLSLQDRLKMVNEKIINPLALNTLQKEKINAVYQDFYTELDKIMKTLTIAQGHPDKSKVEPLEKTRDEKIKLVLSGEQFLKYQEL